MEKTSYGGGRYQTCGGGGGTPLSALEFGSCSNDCKGRRGGVRGYIGLGGGVRGYIGLGGGGGGWVLGGGSRLFEPHAC